MEKPYKGRALIKESFEGITIEIPAKRNWLYILFITGWLGGWFIGELFALAFVFGYFGGSMGGTNLLLLFWLIAWTAAGLATIRTWLYMIGGSVLFPKSATTR